jgi:hypothetical protein
MKCWRSVCQRRSRAQFSQMWSWQTEQKCSVPGARPLQKSHFWTRPYLGIQVRCVRRGSLASAAREGMEGVAVAGGFDAPLAGAGFWGVAPRRELPLPALSAMFPASRVEKDRQKCWNFGRQ